MQNLLDLSVDNSAHWTMCAQLYLKGFPPKERDSLDNMRKRFEKGHFKIYYDVCEQNQVRVMGVVYALKTLEAVLLEYFVVREDFRRQGLAQAFLQALYDGVLSGKKALLLEVVNPEFSQTKAKELAKIALFERFGAVLCPQIHFELPFVENGQKQAMRLLCKHSVHTQLTELDLQKALDEIFAEIYTPIVIEAELPKS